jgi:hypothetical protein
MDKITKWKKEVDKLTKKQIKQNEEVGKFLKATGSALCYEQFGDFLTQTLTKINQK